MTKFKERLEEERAKLRAELQRIDDRTGAVTG